jgi:hypothetical protein
MDKGKNKKFSIKKRVKQKQKQNDRRMRARNSKFGTESYGTQLKEVDI